MRRSHMPVTLALWTVSALIATGVVSGTMLATPAPNQLVWRFAGQSNFEQQGATINNAGDVNGDGVRDIIVGLYTVQSTMIGNHTSARLYSGSDGSFLFKIVSPVQSHGSMNPVASFGDLTGDGRAEFGVGTPGAQVGNNQRAGVVRIFSSSGTLLATKAGSSHHAQFGASLACAGDVDADGLLDIIVGAPGDSEAYVYSGDPDAGFPLLATLQGDREPDFRFGGSVGRVGDIDGDGRSEVIVGAPYYDDSGGGHPGRVHVYSVEEPTEPLFVITGAGPRDLLGTDVDGGRDLNGDSVPDFVASALGTDATGPLGYGFVRTYSGVDGSVLQTFTSSKPGDLYGFSAELSDSCDGGKPTLIVGAPQAVNPSSGKITGRVVALNAGSGSELAEIYGEGLLDGMGISVGGFVDLTGDGKGEFLAGAYGMSDPPGLWVNGSGFVYSCVDIPRPNIVAVPNPVDLGNVAVGATQSMAVQIQNQGDANLVVTGLALAAGSNAAFGGVVPATPFTISPSGNQQITIQYDPTAMGMHGGTLQVHSNDPDSPTYAIVLMGKGLLRRIAVSPASVALGGVNLGDTSWASITAKNTGNESLSVNSIALATGTSADYSLGALPTLPKVLGPGQQFAFQAILTPSSGGTHGGTIEIGSDDTFVSTVTVPLSGSGVPPNLPPTAVITMDVPYTHGATTIQFRGENSSDSDGTITSYQWDFGHGGQVSSAMNPLHTFPCSSPQPCLFVVRLMVIDDDGASDPTSVTAIVWSRPVRSRFYGAIEYGGSDAPDETVVEAWIDGTLVAESLSQTHLGRSVYAIEVPPDVSQTGDGGTDGDAVVFKYKGSTADQTGTFHPATDQELDLTAPYHVGLGVYEWCLQVALPGVEICGPSRVVPEPEGMDVELQEWPVPPIPLPGPLHTVGTAFELRMIDAATGQQLTMLPDTYEIRLSYTDSQLADAGIVDESSLGLYYIQGSEWALAGRDALDAPSNQIVTTLNHASIFALVGTAVEATPTATSTATSTPTATATPRKLHLPMVLMSG